MHNDVTIDKIVVVLGHENSPDGDLSQDALSRIGVAADYLNKLNKFDSILLITTGGFGENFNKSNIPHNRLIMNNLEKLLIKNVKFIEYINSCNTFEDMLGILRVIRDLNINPKDIVIITSKYHRLRSEYIFARVLPSIQVEFITDGNCGTKMQQEHESKSFKFIRRTIVDVSSFSRNIDNSLVRLTEELRHYDSLSYLGLSSSFAAIYVYINVKLPVSAIYIKSLFTLIMILLSSLSYMIYLRFAGTAASARRILFAASFIMGQPHLDCTTNVSGKYTLRTVKTTFIILIIAWIGSIMYMFKGSGVLKFIINYLLQY